MSHQDQNPCPQHGEHHGICWPCADARGRKANAAEAALEAARAEVARMRPVVEAAVGYDDADNERAENETWDTKEAADDALQSLFAAIAAFRKRQNRRTPEPAKEDK